MEVFKGELTISFDVDDTLVMWKDNIYKPGEGKIKIVDPTDSEPRFLVPHQRHINFLKKCYKRGYQITIWSAGGWAWAEAAVIALGLEEFVHKVESKPLKYVDDLTAVDILGTRIYLSEDGGSQ